MYLVCSQILRLRRQELDPVCISFICAAVGDVSVCLPRNHRGRQLSAVDPADLESVFGYLHFGMSSIASLPKTDENNFNYGKFRFCVSCREQ